MGTFLTARDVAKWIKASPKTVRRLTDAGELTGYDLPHLGLRYDADEVYAWIEKHRTGNGNGASPDAHE
jgi:hypothetical protein